MERRGEAALDWPWSGVHFATGFGLGLKSIPLGAAVLLLVGYEVVEAGLRRVRTVEGGGVFEHESGSNIVADVAVGLGGWWVGQRWGRE